MSPSSSGSEARWESRAFPIADASQVGEARRYAGTLAARLGLDDVRGARLGILITELGTNLVKYARGGSLIVRACERGSVAGVEVVSIDRGPGFADADRVLEDGFSTGGSAGTGLGAVRRQADVFDLYSEPEKGTGIVAVVFAAPIAREEFAVGAVCVPIDGETVSGDAWCVQTLPDGWSAIMADGLGHGPHAHAAARDAIDAFRKNADLSPELVLAKIHARLKGTRGAAAMVMRLSSEELVWAGVGNVRAFVQNPGEARTLISQNGTLGLQMRAVRPQSRPWNSGALITHTDGLTSRWDFSDQPRLMRKHPSLVAAFAHRDYARGSDDAAVAVLSAARSGNDE